jgi:hypothetical protein
MMVPKMPKIIEFLGEESERERRGDAWTRMFFIH